jgi:peptide/nickel transport system substrate-binding protein
MGPMLTRRQLLGASLATGAGVLLGACAPMADERSLRRRLRPAAKATLRVGALGRRADIQRDPHGIVRNDSDLLVLNLVYDTMTVPGRSLVTSARLMNDWKSDVDQTEWRFTIAGGAVFHDGTPVTSDDVAWSLERLRATELGRRRLPGIDASGIDTDGRRAVVVTTNAPNSELPLMLRVQTFTVREGTTDVVGTPGTGPFRLDSYRDGDATLVRNDHWHGGEAAVETIEVTMFEDVAALVDAVVEGEVDYASNVGGSGARSAVGIDGIRTVRRPNELALPLVMRVADGPFADVRVREAIRLGVDRQALVDEVFEGYGRVANDVVGTGDPNYSDNVPDVERDVERAVELLDEAGFDRSITYELFTADDAPQQVDAAKAIAAQLGEIGVAVKVTEQDIEQFEQQTWCKAPFYVTSSKVNDSLAYSAITAMLSGAPANEAAFADPDFDEAYADAVESFVPNLRQARFRELQSIQRERAGYLVWGTAEGVDLMSEKVHDPPRVAGYGRVLLESTWVES